MNIYKQEFEGSDLILGDIHGSTRFANNLKEQKPDTHIIQIGDLGLWIKDGEFVNKIQEIMEEKNLTMHAIRGNHDNPVFWENTSWDKKYSRINMIQDYQTVIVSGKPFLCVGGGISIDRKMRKPYRSYWPEEEVKYKKVNEKHYGLLCHSAPTYFNLTTPERWSWYNRDPSLKKDMIKDREKINNLVKDIDCKLIIGGHFHNNAREYRRINGKEIKYRCLNIDEHIKIEEV